MHEILPCRTAAEALFIDDELDQSHAQDVILSYKQEVKATHTTSSQSLTAEDPELINYKIMQKIAPMLDMECDGEFEWSYKFLKLNRKQNVSINDLFYLIPFSGLLKPNEVQNVNIMFRPKTDISVRATLECEVLGGPPETIIVTGQSSNLLYKINTQRINFKIRSFHENATEQLLISNISQLPFEYTTYLNEPEFENDLPGRILNLIPCQKVLEPEEQIEMKVEMRPGVMGYFQTKFLLEIGHLPLLHIEVFGWGVIPQVYFCLPRPDIFKVRRLFIKINY